MTFQSALSFNTHPKISLTYSYPHLHVGNSVPLVYASAAYEKTVYWMENSIPYCETHVQCWGNGNSLFASLHNTYMQTSKYI